MVLQDRACATKSAVAALSREMFRLRGAQVEVIVHHGGGAAAALFKQPLGYDAVSPQIKIDPTLQGQLRSRRLRSLGGTVLFTLV